MCEGCSGDVPTFPVGGTLQPVLSGNTATITVTVRGDTGSTGYTLGVHRRKGSAPTFSGDRIAGVSLVFTQGTPTNENFQYVDTINDSGDYYYAFRIECAGAAPFGGTAFSSPAFVRLPSFTGNEIRGETYAAQAANIDLTILRDTTSAGFRARVYAKTGSAPTFDPSELIATVTVDTSGSGSYVATIQDTGLPTQGIRYYKARIENIGGAYTGADESKQTIVCVPHFTEATKSIQLGDQANQGNRAHSVVSVEENDASRGYTVGLYRKKGSAPTFQPSERVDSKSFSVTGTPDATIISPIDQFDNIEDFGDFYYACRMEFGGVAFGGDTVTLVPIPTGDYVRVPNYTGAELELNAVVTTSTVVVKSTVKRGRTSESFRSRIYRKVNGTPTFLPGEDFGLVDDVDTSQADGTNEVATYSGAISNWGPTHYKGRIENEDNSSFVGTDQSVEFILTLPSFSAPDLTAILRSDKKTVDCTMKVLGNLDTGSFRVKLYRKRDASPSMVASELVSNQVIATASGVQTFTFVDTLPLDGPGAYHYKARIEFSSGSLIGGEPLSSEQTVDPGHVISPGISQVDPPPVITEDTVPSPVQPTTGDVNSESARTSDPSVGVDEHIVLVKVTGSPARGFTFTDEAYLDSKYNRMEWWYHKRGGCGRFRLNYRGIFPNATKAVEDGWEIHVRIKLDGESDYTTWYRGVIRSIHDDRSANEVLAEVRGHGYVEQLTHIQVQKRYPKGVSVAQIVNDIIDRFVKPHSRIVRPSDLRPTDNNGVDASTYVLKGEVHFECSALKALKFLADLQGDREFGVAPDRAFFWRDSSAVSVAKNFYASKDQIRVLGGGKAFNKLNQLKVEGKYWAGREYLKIRSDPTDVTDYGLFERPAEIPWLTHDDDSNRWADNIISSREDRESWKTFTWDGVDQRLESNHPDAALGKIQFYGVDVSNDKETFPYGKVKYVKGGFLRKGELMEIGSAVQQPDIHQPVLTATFYVGAWRKDLVEELEAEMYEPLHALQGKLRQFRNPNNDIVLPSEGTTPGEPFALWDVTNQRVVKYMYDATTWIPGQHVRSGPTLPAYGSFYGQEFFKTHFDITDRSGDLWYWNGFKWVLFEAQNSVFPHKDTHVSGGSDAFISTDLLEALVKRLRFGGSDFELGAITDGQFLKRSGSQILSQAIQAQLQASTFAFTGTGSMGTGALGFTPLFAVYVGINTVVNGGNTAKTFCAGIATGTGSGARCAGMMQPQTGNTIIGSDTDAIGIGGDGAFDRELDVTGWGSGGVDLAWSAGVSSHNGMLLVVGS